MQDVIEKMYVLEVSYDQNLKDLKGGTHIWFRKQSYLCIHLICLWLSLKLKMVVITIIQPHEGGIKNNIIFL